MILKRPGKISSNNVSRNSYYDTDCEHGVNLTTPVLRCRQPSIFSENCPPVHALSLPKQSLTRGLAVRQVVMKKSGDDPSWSRFLMADAFCICSFSGRTGGRRHLAPFASPFVRRTADTSLTGDADGCSILGRVTCPQTDEVMGDSIHLEAEPWTT